MLLHYSLCLRPFFFHPTLHLHTPPNPPLALSLPLHSCPRPRCTPPPPSFLWIPYPPVPVTAWLPARPTSSPPPDIGLEMVASQCNTQPYYGVFRCTSPLSPSPKHAGHIIEGGMTRSHTSVSSVESPEAFFPTCGGNSLVGVPYMGSPPMSLSQK